MKTATSKDGTTIAYDQTGNGPPLVLVDGALNSRVFGLNGPLAAILADRFTVVTYDRRGRGDSGDTPPYAVQREIEDLEAVIDTTGGPADVYGISSGAGLALEAACAVPAKVAKLALYEPPFVVDDTRPPVPADAVGQVTGREALPARRFPGARGGRRRHAADARLGQAQGCRAYPALRLDDHGWRPAGPPLAGRPVGLAHRPDAGHRRWQEPRVAANATRALAQALPGASHRTLPGQTHIVKPKPLAPVLADFFTSAPGNRSASGDA